MKISSIISTKIVDCEKEKSDKPLIQFLADGMSEYLEEKVRIGN